MLLGNTIPKPLMLVLSLGVLLPTACVLWFMLEAVNNERLAARQKLSDFYRIQLKQSATKFAADWNKRVDKTSLSKKLASQRFVSVIDANLASSAIIFDAGGFRVYPEIENYQYQRPSKSQLEAERLEFQSRDFNAAYQVYRQRSSSDNPDTKGQALLGMARCLAKLAQKKRAAEVLIKVAENDALRNARDRQGRSITLNSTYMLISKYSERLSERQEERYRNSLLASLNNYDHAVLASQQRLYLMSEMKNLEPTVNFSTYAAERLAQQYIENYGDSNKSSTYIAETNLPGIYHLALNQGMVLLFERADIEALFDTFKRSVTLPANVSLKFIRPGDIIADNETAVDLGGYWQHWQLAFVFSDDNLHNQAAKQQITAYLWVGMLIILGIVLLGVVSANYILRQARSHRLKNDLIATVSHELKTPLSSIRALVDTLLLSKTEYDTTTKDYLKLIAKENARLSQLIDNFLTFSRMERGKQMFEFSSCSPLLIVQDVVEAAGESLESKGFNLVLSVVDDLPPIQADKDMLVTAMLNLVENAEKYSLDTKYIEIKAEPLAENVCFSVCDRGVGMEKRILKKIFERFYRVENELSRSTEGCGIGLNIVEFIVKAHGGHIDVSSEMGEGSVFRIVIPQGEIS